MKFKANDGIKMGELMLRVGDFKGTEHFYIESFKSDDNEQNKSICFLWLGMVKLNQGEYEEPVRYFQKSVEIDKPIL